MRNNPEKQRIEAYEKRSNLLDAMNQKKIDPKAEKEEQERVNHNMEAIEHILKIEHFTESSKHLIRYLLFKDAGASERSVKHAESLAKNENGSLTEYMTKVELSQMSFNDWISAAANLIEFSKLDFHDVKNIYLTLANTIHRLGDDPFAVFEAKMYLLSIYTGEKKAKINLRQLQLLEQLIRLFSTKNVPEINTKHKGYFENLSRTRELSKSVCALYYSFISQCENKEHYIKQVSRKLQIPRNKQLRILEKKKYAGKQYAYTEVELRELTSCVISAIHAKNAQVSLIMYSGILEKLEQKGLLLKDLDIIEKLLKNMPPSAEYIAYAEETFEKKFQDYLTFLEEKRITGKIAQEVQAPVWEEYIPYVEIIEEPLPLIEKERISNEVPVAEEENIQEFVDEEEIQEMDSLEDGSLEEDPIENEEDNSEEIQNTADVEIVSAEKEIAEEKKRVRTKINQSQILLIQGYLFDGLTLDYENLFLETGDKKQRKKVFVQGEDAKILTERRKSLSKLLGLDEMKIRYFGEQKLFTAYEKDYVCKNGSLKQTAPHFRATVPTLTTPLAASQIHTLLQEFQLQNNEKNDTKLYVLLNAIEQVYGTELKEMFFVVIGTLYSVASLFEIRTQDATSLVTSEGLSREFLSDTAVEIVRSFLTQGVTKEEIMLDIAKFTEKNQEVSALFAIPYTKVRAISAGLGRSVRAKTIEMPKTLQELLKTNMEASLLMKIVARFQELAPDSTKEQFVETSFELLEDTNGKVYPLQLGLILETVKSLELFNILDSTSSLKVEEINTKQENPPIDLKDEPEEMEQFDTDDVAQENTPDSTKNAEIENRPEDNAEQIIEDTQDNNEEQQEEEESKKEEVTIKVVEDSVETETEEVIPEEVITGEENKKLKPYYGQLFSEEEKAKTPWMVSGVMVNFWK